MKRIRVVAAALIENGLVLAAKRGEGMRMAGLWEFPGGKVEPGEGDRDALRRELREELAIEVRVQEQLGSVVHRYSDFEIELIAYHCTDRQGAPVAREHAELRWLGASELWSVNWAAADIHLLDSVASECRACRLCLYVHPRAQAQLEAWAKAEPESHFGVLARIMSTLPLARSDVDRLVQLIAAMDSEPRGTAAHRLGLFLPAAQWKHGAQLLRSQAPEVERWLDGFSSLQAASGARAWHTVTRVDDDGRGDVRPGALVKVEAGGIRFVTPQRKVIFKPVRWQEPTEKGMTEWGRITVQAEPGKLTISLDDKPLISARTPTAEERGFVREVLAARPSDETLCKRAERCCLDAMPLLGVECNLKESLGEPRRVHWCEAFLPSTRDILKLKEQPLPASCKP
jgi:8-oxo-dGTP diphosphatase